MRDGPAAEGERVPESLALLIPSYRGGGAEGATVRLANELVGRGLAVELVTLSAEGSWRAQLRPEVMPICLRTQRASTSVPRLAGYLRARVPDVLVSNMFHLNVASVVAHRLAASGSRLILIEHNELEAKLRESRQPKRALMRQAIRWAYPRAQVVAGTSQGVADSLAHILSWNVGRICVLPNGIPIQEIREQAAEPVEHPWFDGSGPPAVVAVGRLVPQKGFDDLLHAFSLLVKATPARLLILGEGPMRGDLERLARELGVDGQVELPGFVANPYAYMARAGAFVLSSHYEGQGVVLLEALACGAGIVATDCPSGPREILGEGEYGLLVPVGHPASLAAALHRVLTDEGLARRLKRGAGGRAAEFSVAAAADRLLRLIQELRDRSPGARPNPA